MPSTRRRFLLGSTAAVAVLSGCAGFGGETATIREVEIELANGTDERHVFHVVIETADGLEEWDSREVSPGTRESVVRSTPEGYDPVAIHGVVDDQQTSAELVGIGGAETGELCLRIVFEYGLGAEPTFLESSDVRC